jgi:hypothetical protein
MSSMRELVRRVLLPGVTAMFVMGVPTVASAQDADPNSGRITFSAAVDFPSTYVFRGIVQETEPGLTVQPYGEVGLALFSGEGGVKSVGVNVGVWHSLHTGTSGTGGVADKLHYEEDFYAALNLGFARDMSLGVTYTAYTSPNDLFGTTHELVFEVGLGTRAAAYVILAQELDGGADGGPNEGTYLELGAGPGWDLAGGKVSVAVPVKLGLSLKDYYESPLDGQDNAFGFFDVGVLFTVPLGFVPQGYGSWNIHGGVNVLALGETTKRFTKTGDDGSKVVGAVGIGFSY